MRQSTEQPEDRVDGGDGQVQGRQPPNQNLPLLSEVHSEQKNGLHFGKEEKMLKELTNIFAKRLHYMHYSR